MSSRPTEASDAIALANYMRRRRLVFIHVANEGRRSARAGGVLKAMGLSPGFPDYLVFSRPASGAAGVAIELKRGAGGRLAKEQRRWLTQLAELGWETYAGDLAGARAHLKEHYG